MCHINKSLVYQSAHLSAAQHQQVARTHFIHQFTSVEFNLMTVGLKDWVRVAGIVCNDGQLPSCSGLQEDLLSTGPMCRYAEDLLPMLKIMAGANADR